MTERSHRSFPYKWNSRHY